MNNYMVIVVIAASVFLSMGIMLVLIPYLQKKGINIGGYLNGVSDINKIISAAFDTLKPFLPNTQVVAVIDKIFDYANKAVEYAEQLYKANEIGVEDRKTIAKEYTLLCLKELNISVTDDLISIIDGAIDGAVLLLPKTHDTIGNIIK